MRVFQALDPSLPPRAGAHPVLPAIAALWFALSLGLGSLLLPAALVDRLAFASGIASLAPALGAPLDLAARCAIALAAAGLGAIAGAMLMRLVDARRSEALLIDGLEAPPIRPLSASDELGGLLDWTDARPFEADIPLFGGTAEPGIEVEPSGSPGDPEGRQPGLIALAGRFRGAIERRRAGTAGAAPPGSFATGSGITESGIATQTGPDFSAEPREAAPRRPLPEAGNAGLASADADSALRASLARLRQLRGAV